MMLHCANEKNIILPLALLNPGGGGGGFDYLVPGVSE